jgi:hypothetical protein
LDRQYSQSEPGSQPVMISNDVPPRGGPPTALHGKLGQTNGGKRISEEHSSIRVPPFACQKVHPVHAGESLRRSAETPLRNRASWEAWANEWGASEFRKNIPPFVCPPSLARKSIRFMQERVCGALPRRRYETVVHGGLGGSEMQKRKRPPASEWPFWKSTTAYLRRRLISNVAPSATSASVDGSGVA